MSQRVQQLALWLAAEELSILSSLALQTAKRISQTMELQALHRCSQTVAMLLIACAAAAAPDAGHFLTLTFGLGSLLLVTLIDRKSHRVAISG